MRRLAHSNSISPSPALTEPLQHMRHDVPGRQPAPRPQSNTSTNVHALRF